MFRIFSFVFSVVDHYCKYKRKQEDTFFKTTEILTYFQPNKVDEMLNTI